MTKFSVRVILELVGVITIPPVYTPVLPLPHLRDKSGNGFPPAISSINNGINCYCLPTASGPCEKARAVAGIGRARGRVEERVSGMMEI
jgi:hypothetical protein